MPSIPVIAIDGPTASGKGTVAARVAAALGWHLLDSGSIYRLLALLAINDGIALDDEPALVEEASKLDVRFEMAHVFLCGRDVSDSIRQEETGNAASKIAVLPGVRAALLARQRAFRRRPGLVADGRDMGSVVFPDSVLKIFLTASVQVRAERRYKQLIDKGIAANIDGLSQDLRERDVRDSSRTVAPLKPCEDSVLLDTSARNVEDAVQFVLQHAMERGIRPAG